MADAQNFTVAAIVVRLLLTSWCVCLCQANSNATVRFQTQPICPTESQKPLLRSLTNVQSKRACLTECSVTPNCSAVHVRSDHLTCWLSDMNEQWSDNWVSSGEESCKSELKDSAALASELSGGLFMWYNFRYSINNQVNADTYKPALMNAKRNVSGLHLSDSNSYAKITMAEAFDTKVGADKDFTVYVKAERQYKDLVFYMRAACENGSMAAGYLIETDGKVTFGHHGVNEKDLSTSAALLPNSQAVVSFAVACHAGGCSAFFNGAVSAMSASEYDMSPGGTPVDLRLGQRHGSNTTLNGRLICFGAWTRQLTLEEFKLVEKSC